MNTNYHLLKQKLNEFIRKFYLNEILRGSIFASTLIFSLYLFLFVWVYFTYPSVVIKTILFFGFLIVAVFALIFWVIRPLIAFLRLENAMPYQNAAHIIGKHFSEVNDKLINTLQLQELVKNNVEENLLLIAGINQKINELKPIPFIKAIPISKNKKYLQYLAVPIFLILSIAVLSPTILKIGTTNFISYNIETLPEAPFQFIVENNNMTVNQGDDFVLKIKLKGNELPNDVYLEDGKNVFKLDKIEINYFNYSFKNLQNNKVIRLKGGGFYSSLITIHVLPRPSILKLNASLSYPHYLKRKDENLSNIGDLTLPEGTKVRWEINTENAEKIYFNLNQNTQLLKPKNGLVFFDAILKQSTSYKISPQNKWVENKDTLSHHISIIKDEFPSISVNASTDSLDNKVSYFTGSITDDYGFSSLKFIYQIKEKSKIVFQKENQIAIRKDLTENSILFHFDFNSIPLKIGQSIDYYFEVADNDGVNGAKKTRSAINTYNKPSAHQEFEQIAKGQQELKSELEKSIQLAKAIEKESKKLAESLLDKKTLEFEDKKKIEQLLNKQQELEETIKNINKIQEKNNYRNKEEVNNKDLLDKQKQIENLFNNVLDDKTKDLLQKLQKLMEQNRKEDTKDELSKMQLDNKSLKNELDRILELYKQLEFEQNLQNKIDRLEDLSKQQKDLAKQSENEQHKENNLKDKQDDINKDFKELQKELEDLAKKNDALERPNDFKNPEKETTEINKNLQESSNQLSKNQMQKAAQNQKQAAEKLQKLAQQLKEQQQSGAEMENNLSEFELKKLLNNLLKTSFEQEKLMLTFRNLNINDPSFKNELRKQSAISDNIKVIADSLYALSKRVPQIESTVNKEVKEIDFNLKKAIEYLNDRNTANANSNQQFALTAMNNLAVMINDALDQLKNAKKNSSPGKGKSGQSLKQLQQMQEQLNKNMQQAKSKMEKEGNQGKVGKGQMSEQFGKMAQQQQMLRNALEKINREDNKDGKGKMGNLNQLTQDMKQTELDLVNKRITEETIRRQKNLIIKLLDAEKAQREQDEDEKRESKAAQQFPPGYQKILEQYLKTIQNGEDLLQKEPANLNHYYKNKVAEYFKLLNLSKP